MSDDRHGATLESLVPRLLALANHWIPFGTEDRTGLVQRCVYDVFEELLEHDIPDFRNERELYRELAATLRQRIRMTARLNVS